MSHEGYHEPTEELSDETKDMHRAIVSLMEELEAIDWYQQRADVCKDPELRAVLVHNKNDEIEHAMMTLEWIRRRSEVFDEDARTYLFSEGSITEIEAKAKAAGSTGAAIETREQLEEPSTAPATATHSGSLGIGSLRKGR